jgi:hypothetical protein
VERSITQAASGYDAANMKAQNGSTSGEDEPALDLRRPDISIGLATRVGPHKTLIGLALVGLCLFVYGASQPNRTNPYLHFVLQAQAWIDGDTSIASPGYQDVMPLGVRADGSSCVATSDDPDCTATGRGIIPFPPLPAWVVLPFVALWGVATNEQLLAAIFAAFDVGIAYWMLGYLPIRQRYRLLTAVFLGFGTVLWYAAAIGTTWFWAHVVAVGCLLLSLGLALSADRAATEPEPLAGLAAAAKGLFHWPGGGVTVGFAITLGSVSALFYAAANRGASPAVVGALGVIVAVAAAALAAAAAEKRGVLLPIGIVVAVVAGMPALVIAGTQSQTATLAVEVVVFVAAVGLWWLIGRAGTRTERFASGLVAALSSPEARQVAAGILFGLAVTARLTILFGFPFLILVGGGGSWLRRGLLAGSGAAIVIVALLVYTFAATGQLFNPAYQYQYVVEQGYTVFNYHADWSITDFRYIPQNLGIMLLQLPKLDPTTYSVFPGNGGTPLCAAGTVRGLFDVACPLMMPDAIGTSILLTSPAFLLAPLAWRPLRRLRIDRATAGATIAVVAIATVNLMHFSQGWVQFGYRFSNDFVPFALILVALGASRLGRLWPFALLVAFSIVVNFWGTAWGVLRGW